MAARGGKAQQRLRFADPWAEFCKRWLLGYFRIREESRQVWGPKEGRMRPLKELLHGEVDRPTSHVWKG